MLFASIFLLSIAITRVNCGPGRLAFLQATAKEDSTDCQCTPAQVLMVGDPDPSGKEERNWPILVFDGENEKCKQATCETCKSMASKLQNLVDNNPTILKCDVCADAKSNIYDDFLETKGLPSRAISRDNLKEGGHNRATLVEISTKFQADCADAKELQQYCELVRKLVDFRTGLDEKEQAFWDVAFFGQESRAFPPFSVLLALPHNEEALQIFQNGWESPKKTCQQKLEAKLAAADELKQDVPTRMNAVLRFFGKSHETDRQAHQHHEARLTAFQILSADYAKHCTSIEGWDDFFLKNKDVCKIGITVAENWCGQYACCPNMCTIN